MTNFVMFGVVCMDGISLNTLMVLATKAFKMKCYSPIQTNLRFSCDLQPPPPPKSYFGAFDGDKNKISSFFRGQKWRVTYQTKGPFYFSLNPNFLLVAVQCSLCSYQTHFVIYEYIYQFTEGLLLEVSVKQMITNFSFWKIQSTISI